MVRGIRAGVVHVNTYGGADGTVPLGGVKQSGNGHDKSLHALDKYTDLKTAWIQLYRTVGGRMGNRILVVGTYDTKDDELTYLAGVIRAQGAMVLTMDVSVLGDPQARQPTGPNMMWPPPADRTIDGDCGTRTMKITPCRSWRGVRPALAAAAVPTRAGLTG